jgi:uncharacterized protein (DUF885 family)
MHFPGVLLMLVITLMSGVDAHGAPGSPMDDEAARLNAVFQEYLKELFRREPLSATRLGEHAFDDQIDDLSAAARKGTLDFKRQTLKRLSEQISMEKLSPAGRIDHDIFSSHLAREIWLEENFRPFEDDPQIYGDYIAESVYLLLTQSSLPRPVNLRNAAARMEKIPQVIAIARQTIADPPRVKVETAIMQTEGAISFYSRDLFELAGPEADKKQLEARAGAISAALKDYLAFLRNEVLPRSNDSWRIGRERFVKKLDLELDAGIPADQVLAEAEREADQVEMSMSVIARQLWGTLFAAVPIPVDDVPGRREMIRRVLDALAADHGEASTLVSDIRATAVAIKKFISANKIIALPEPDQCRIIEMPEFMRGNSVAYLNPAPPLDTRGSSEYSISPPPANWSKERAESLLREYNRSMLKILTIHEAYPGHYVQLEYSNRCPSPIRKILSSGTFAEGWAVYTEQMMLDQGFGHGDLSLRLHQLKFYLRAVVNAVLDHQMHAGQMTDAEALDLLMNRAFQTEGEAVGKIIRAKQTSCQLSTYFVGWMAFFRLRQSIQKKLGSGFDLASYHQAVLAHGTIPVKYLPELVESSLDSAGAEKPRGAKTRKVSSQP